MKKEGVFEKIETAQKMIGDLCHGGRKWTMSIPARPDYDPDLVISAALAAANAELARLREENVRLRGELQKRMDDKSPF